MSVLSGSMSIVYPMGLPEYDRVRMELENRGGIHFFQDYDQVRALIMTEPSHMAVLTGI
jgi:hypothetical protein